MNEQTEASLGRMDGIDWEKVARAHVSPVRLGILEVVHGAGNGGVSATDLCVWTGESLDVVADHVSRLEQIGLIRLSGTFSVDGQEQHCYVLSPGDPETHGSSVRSADDAWLGAGRRRMAFLAKSIPRRMILRALVQAERPMTSEELVHESGLPHSTVDPELEVLVADGAVRPTTRDPTGSLDVLAADSVVYEADEFWRADELAMTLLGIRNESFEDLATAEGRQPPLDSPHPRRMAGEDEIGPILAGRLGDLMRERDLSAADLASLTPLDDATVEAIREGRHPILIEHAALFAGALGVRPEQLFDGVRWIPDEKGAGAWEVDRDGR